MNFQFHSNYASVRKLTVVCYSCQSGGFSRSQIEATWDQDQPVDPVPETEFFQTSDPDSPEIEQMAGLNINTAVFIFSTIAACVHL